ncbi:MAG: phosphotransferase [Mycoplasma sp.]
MNKNFITQYIAPYIKPNEEVLSINQIKNSFSNDVYKIDTSLNKYYLRLAKQNPNINRHDENLVINKLSTKIYFFNTETGDYLRDWIEAEINNDWNQTKIASISKKLNYLHSLNLNIERFNPFQYWEKFETSIYFEEYAVMYKSLVDKYKNQMVVVCHCDLNPLNILLAKNNEIEIIDFERVKLNSPYWDFANLARENMTSEQISYLCQLNKLDFSIMIDYLKITIIHALMWTLTVDQNLITDYQKNIFKRFKFSCQLDKNNI